MAVRPTKEPQMLPEQALHMGRKKERGRETYIYSVCVCGCVCVCVACGVSFFFGKFIPIVNA